MRAQPYSHAPAQLGTELGAWQHKATEFAGACRPTLVRLYCYEGRHGLGLIGFKMRKKYIYAIIMLIRVLPNISSQK